MFADPSQGDQCKPAEVLGHVLIIKPVQLRDGVPTANYGPKDAIEVDVVDLDQDGRVFRNCLWFNGVLIGSLRSHVGELVLGRMAQGQAKPGQSAPFVLETVPEGEDKQRAQQWVNANPGFRDGFAQPSQAAHVPTQQQTSPQPVAAAAAGLPNQITPETAALLAQLQNQQR